MGGQYRLTTLGCKVNQYESQQLREVLESFGLRPVNRSGEATVAIVNTCAVTEQASRKNRQAIRRVACGGRVPVVVVGCGAAAEGERLRRIPGVCAVIGHDADAGLELRAFLENHLGVEPPSRRFDAKRAACLDPLDPRAGQNEGWMMADAHRAGRPATASRAAIDDPSRSLVIVNTPDALLGRIETFAGHQRAFLKVQDGCDAHCTYCIIPRLRPALRSKPIDTAVAEARDLVRAGHREIIITGIFLGAYGRETALRKRWAGRGSPLAALVRALARVDGLERLRLSSLEPADVDESLLEAVAANRVCVPHFHLPLQSGSAKVLRRMNRQYTPDQYVDMVTRVRAALDRPAISTDVIVGFPGETDADFEDSLAMARYAEFVKIHAFPFSPREKTAAARWHNEFVPAPTARDRMNRLAEVERDCALRFRRRFLGDVERVIVEHDDESVDPPRSTVEGGRTDRVAAGGRRVRHGRTDRYFATYFESSEVRAGEVVAVRIDRVTPTRTHGTRIDDRGANYPLPVWSGSTADESPFGSVGPA